MFYVQNLKISNRIHKFVVADIIRYRFRLETTMFEINRRRA